MRYIEYGKDNDRTILLLHGGGLSWWNYKEAAEILQNSFRVILPFLDGHANSDKPFTTIEDNAAGIIEFIDMYCGGSVFLIGGLSLGGQILLEILSQRSDICEYAVIESALVIPSRLTQSLIKPAIVSSYGLIKYRWFAKLQFKSLRIKSDLFEAYFEDTRAISKKDMIALLRSNAGYCIKETIKTCCAKMYVLVGEKENNAMRKSAEVINRVMQGSVLNIIPGRYHGEFSINHGKDYAKMVERITTEI